MGLEIGLASEGAEPGKSVVRELEGKVFAGESISREDALRLLDAPLEELAEAADRIRERFCGNAFDMCTIINGKCGKCSEDCKYCAGASRVHCNLESSERFFPEVCTTHTFAEKVETLKAAKRAGLSVCSGGIMGLGETMEDRIDMVLTARELGVKSVPVNLLNPIPGTPYEKNRVLSGDELCRITAVFRFLIPDGMIRLAGGRGLVADKGEKCFRSGANAAISGDMLTTAGITVETDMELVEKLGYEVRIGNE